MNSTELLDIIRNLTFAFYRFLLKLIINAHIVINQLRDRFYRNKDDTASSNVRLKDLRLPTSGSLGSQVNFNAARQPSQHPGLSFKTPITNRLKFISILRRLSLRNFMEYCVIALNEASSSSCSNKFDLNSCEQPVWLLGQQYDLPQDADKLANDIRSKLWITYRRNFPPIDEATRYTTDRGFGCMIRCGQMVLANALILKNLGRDWRWSPNGLEANPDTYFRILKLFQDKDGCQYSIHNIVRTGQQEGKVIGEWFGPNTIAQALKRMAMSLSDSVSANNELLISVDTALDNVVVMDEIRSRFKRKISCNPSNKANKDQEMLPQSSGDKHDPLNSCGSFDQWVPGILFIQLRLGLSKINSLYFAALKKTFQFKNSLGIIGGRPNHALYLIGYTDDDIIYLDPHSTQQYIDFDSDETGEEFKPLPIDSTYHCANPEKMSIDRLDPSLALCFYFHTEQEFDEWCHSSNELLIKSEQAPMFEINESRPTGWSVPLTSTMIKSTYQKKSKPEKSRYQNHKEETFTDLKMSDRSASDNSQTTNDDEEFEMLG